VKINLPPENNPSARRRPSWRHYQLLLRHRSHRRVNRQHGPWIALFVATLTIVVAWWLFAARTPDGDQQVAAATRPPTSPTETRSLLDKADVRDFLASQPLNKILEGDFDIRFGDRSLHVESTIDRALQQYLQKQLYRRTSRYIAIVVLTPHNGEVLALVNYAREGRDPNPCLSSQFPAASLFKIVTAAAALEKCGYSSQTPLVYNGASHTLYKSQLKKVRNRYTRHTTLEKSFARSVNPVFGKIGRHCLGATHLRHYADNFGFDKAIAFELNLPPSQTQITDKPYQWAEIASGFNQETIISPLHGAIMAAVVPAGGRLVEPAIIRRITDQEGNALYQPLPATAAAGISLPAARELGRLMRRTVTNGTARKTFRRVKKDKVLSQLTIGGKTGSIDTRDHGARYDWFAGYADGPDRKDAIAVAVLVAHEKFIGRRAGEYARRAIREHFRRRFENRDQANRQTTGDRGGPST
jgi:cell division protein FtsI/penicillin-binding protein 2